MPERHQLSRRKGYRKPAGSISVGRPGRFGNPFETAGEFERVLSAILDGAEYLDLRIRTIEYGHMKYIADHIGELRGKDLCCWCSLDKEACHANVLIKYANR